MALFECGGANGFPKKGYVYRSGDHEDYGVVQYTSGTAFNAVGKQTTGIISLNTGSATVRIASTGSWQWLNVYDANGEVVATNAAEISADKTYTVTGAYVVFGTDSDNKLTINITVTDT